MENKRQKAIIIDDIVKARDFLKRDLISFCPDIEIIGEAEGVVSGLKIIKKLRPDIVFLDVNMNDGSGFDILELLDEIHFKVIFTTASDAHAIKAFKFSAVDYLLKPIDVEELIKAVKKAVSQRLGDDQMQVDLLRDSVSNSQSLEKIALHTAEKIHICELKDIIRCESSVNYTTFYFRDKHQVLVTKTLKFYDQILTGSGFLRTHQSHLINLLHVKEFIKSDGGYILMNDNTSIPVSARKRAEVVQVISSLK
tara:strand:- start:783 stop:1541 length:759 start_codon:yes stop_codon:yes gene_type:complete